MSRLRKPLLPALMLAVLFSLSPAMAGDTIWEKVAKSAEDARARVKNVLEEPADAADPSKWTRYCVTTGLCTRLPGGKG
jgi:hypothetical protein